MMRRAFLVALATFVAACLMSVATMALAASAEGGTTIYRNPLSSLEGLAHDGAVEVVQEGGYRCVRVAMTGGTPRLLVPLPAAAPGKFIRVRCALKAENASNLKDESAGQQMPRVIILPSDKIKDETGKGGGLGLGATRYSGTFDWIDFQVLAFLPPDSAQPLTAAVMVAGDNAKAWVRDLTVTLHDRLPVDEVLWRDDMEEPSAWTVKGGNVSTGSGLDGASVIIPAGVAMTRVLDTAPVRGKTVRLMVLGRFEKSRRRIEGKFAGQVSIREAFGQKPVIQLMVQHTQKNWTCRSAVIHIPDDADKLQLAIGRNDKQDPAPIGFEVDTVLIDEVRKPVEEVKQPIDAVKQPSDEVEQPQTEGMVLDGWHLK